MFIIAYIALILAKDNGAHIEPWILTLSLILCLLEAAMYLMILVAWIIGIIQLWRER